MTVLSGDVVKAQTFDDFIEFMGYTYDDVFSLALSEEEQQEVIAEQNEFTREGGEIESFDELHIDEQRNIVKNLNEFHDIIGRTLEEDERTFVHLYDGTVHTIVEVY